MNRFKNILLLLVLTMVVSTVSASASSINLCMKQINTGGSWGVCDPAQAATYGWGTFAYDAVGATMEFTASASAPNAYNGEEYSLIYYKDTDPEHILASTKAVNVLATDIAEANAVSFSGTWVGGDIPAADDINPRGKIWMVKSTEINPDGTLKWTGYANGVVMINYMFESDLHTVANDPAGAESTVLTRMGGITFDDGIVNTVGDVTCEGNYVLYLSPLNPTTVSGVDVLLFNTIVAPTTSEMLGYVWTIDGSPVDPLLVTSGAFASEFTATGYNVNNELVNIQKTVQIGVSSTCGQVIAPVSTIWTIEPQIKSIEVDVDSINFGGVVPGGSSEEQSAIVTNTGNVPVIVDVTASDMVSGTNEITDENVEITESSNDIEVDDDVTVLFVLNVPGNAIGGTYTGTVEFATS